MKKIFFILILIVAQTKSHAQNTTVSVSDKRETDDSKRVDSSGFEKSDLRTGSTYFEIPFFSLPVSSKLNLNVAASFSKVESLGGAFTGVFDVGNLSHARTGFGGWNLEVPRIIGSRYEEYVCGRSSAFTFVVPGQAPIKFFVNNRTDLYPGANYISGDHWIARCKSSVADPYQVSISNFQTWTPYTSTGDFEIISPNGVIFTLSKLAVETVNGRQIIPNLDSYRSSTVEGISLGAPPFYATRVSDQFGHWISYKFTTGLLTSIETSQGQSVRLEYTAKQFTVEAPKSTTKRTFTVQVLDKISHNGKSWSFEYALCTDKFGTNCFDTNYVSTTNSFGTVLKYVLRNIVRPDLKKISLEYTNYLGVGEKELYSPRPGINYHLKAVTLPNSLRAEYSFYSTCSFFFDGLGPSSKEALQGLNLDQGPSGIYRRLCKYQLPISSRKLISSDSTSRSTNYYYHVPDYPSQVNELYSKLFQNFNMGSLLTPGGYDKLMTTIAGTTNVSYTFEIPWGTGRFSVYKYRRDPLLGDLGLPLRPEFADTYMLLEKSIFPLPASTAADIALPEPLPLPPPLPPSIAVSNLKSEYAIGENITISFNFSTTIPITGARCLINGSNIPCFASGGSVSVGVLPQGLHHLTISLLDASGAESTQQTVFLNVSSGSFPAPTLAVDLTEQKSIPGKMVTLQARFMGTVTSYKWYKDGVLIPNADQASLKITIVSSADFGHYSVTAFNENSATASKTVAVKLDPAVLTPILNELLLE